MNPTRPPPRSDRVDDTTAWLKRDGGDDETALSLLVSGAKGVSVVALSETKPYTIGRAPDCDVFIDDESVSRRHAVLNVGPQLTIEDLGSRNGTTVQGRAVARGQRVSLGIGAVVEVGAVTLLLQRAPGLVGITGAPPRPSASPGAKERGPVVHDPTMQRLYAMLDVIAPSPLAVLILGETGTGKEVFAEEIHRRSLRATAPFLRLNCAALAESILESELFGSEKGAFTGAVQSKPGLFEAANGGTLFLDEVGELSPGTQAKLLRVVESGEVMRLGSTKARRVDVRFVSATNRDLRAAIVKGTFRSDLFFRLNGISVVLPPLRKRTADVLPLAEVFIARAAASNRKPAPRLTDAAAQALAHHAWQGNVRELKNVIDRAVVFCQSDTLDVADLTLVDPSIAYGEEARTNDIPSQQELPVDVPPAASSPPATDARPSGSWNDLRVRMSDLERRAVEDALQRVGGNQTKAAQMLGISRRALINKIEAFGLSRPRKK